MWEEMGAAAKGPDLGGRRKEETKENRACCKDPEGVPV